VCGEVSGGSARGRVGLALGYGFPQVSVGSARGRVGLSMTWHK